MGIAGPVVWNSATFAAAGRENLQEVEETQADGTVQKVSKVVKKERQKESAASVEKVDTTHEPVLGKERRNEQES